MKENLFETQYDVTKKTKIKKFYEKSKILIFSSIFILLIAVASYTLYLDKKEKKKIIMTITISILTLIKDKYGITDASECDTNPDKFICKMVIKMRR